MFHLMPAVALGGVVSVAWLPSKTARMAPVERSEVVRIICPHA